MLEKVTWLVAKQVQYTDETINYSATIIVKGGRLRVDNSVKIWYFSKKLIS